MSLTRPKSDSALLDLSSAPEDVRLTLEQAFSDLEERARQDEDELSDEKRHGLIEELIRIRPPSGDTIIDEKSVLQKILILVRLYAGSVTATNRNHFYPEPWGTLIDMATTGASFESGVILWYLFGSDINDIHERVRAEGRGSFIKGTAIGFLKILLSSVPPAILGLGIGSLINYFNEEINQRPWLKILCQPPVARFITGPLAIAPYLITKYVLNRIYPPNRMDFNRTPALHPLQRIALFGARAYDSLTLNEIFYTGMSHFSPETVKLGLIHASVAGFDQLALFHDTAAFDGSMYDVQPPPFLNHSDIPPQQNRVEILPDDDIEEGLLKDKEELIPHDEDDFQPADELGRYNNAMLINARNKSDLRCDGVKIALWYGLRTTASISAGVLVSAATNIWGGLHPEEWSDSLRLCFYGFTVLTTVYAVERGMENAHRIPQIGHRLSSSCASLFGRNHDDIDHDNDEQTHEHLLEHEGMNL